MVRICCLVTRPIFSRFGFGDPLSTPAARLSRFTVGGVLRTNVKERSSKIVISAGTTSPTWADVRSLYALVNSMMLMPCGPSAVPTGGAGVARPACSSSLRIARTFFLLIGPGLVDLLDLQQVELDRRLPAEHVDQHFELALLGVDLVDLAVEVGERPVDHAYRLADLELDPDLRRFLLHLLLDGPDLFLLERHRAVG